MINVFITGANRGIGLEFVKQLLKRENYYIFASCRNPSEANELNKIQLNHNNNIIIIKLDVTNDEDIKSLTDIIGNKPIDILLLNAGIGSYSHLDILKRDDCLNVININCVSPMLIGQLLYDNVKSSKHKQIIGITSIMGSIRYCRGNTYTPYRISKAAMNMAFQSFVYKSKENKDDVHTLLIHPGWVKTDMGTQNADIELQESIEKMLNNVIDKYKSLINGGFYSYLGNIMKW